MESLYRTHDYLLRTKGSTLVRNLFYEIDEKEKLIGIVGSRGIGKTTFLLDWVAQKYDSHEKRCLYVNLNQFFFTTTTLVDFAETFVSNGGELLLLDQIFKYPGWQKELLTCRERFPQLQIIYTCSMAFGNAEEKNFPGKCYLLRGFSLREFLEIKTGITLPTISLEDIIKHHREFCRTVLESINPCNWMQDYLHHGYYPLFLEKRNYSENLLKNVNMMLEVDMMYIRNIDQRLLPKLRKLLYLIAKEAPSSINVSRLASNIETSRSTVTNYVLAMQDAHLLSLVERRTVSGNVTAKTPSKVLIENSNLCYVLTPESIDLSDVLQTFFRNQIGPQFHLTSPSKRGVHFVVDDQYEFRIDKDKSSRYNSERYYAIHELSIGRDNQIPLWVFGFLY